MKKLYFVFVLFTTVLFFPDFINSQILFNASGSCDQVSYTFAQPSEVVYDGGIVTQTDCGGESGICVVVLTSIYLMRVKYYLEKKNGNGSFSIVQGPKTDGTAFKNLTKGTYRVRYSFPSKIPCKRYCSNNPGFIKVYNYNGQYYGYWGEYAGGTGDKYSNEVLVGPTTDSDIAFDFVDPNGGFSPIAFDYLDEVFIDMSGSKHYDIWWLGIREVGPLYNRIYNPGLNWHFGTATTVNLTALWEQQGWDFEVNHSYEVTLAIENLNCRNGVEYPGTEWTYLSKWFFVCPFGTGCRSGILDEKIFVAPNPAREQIQLVNFIPEFDKDYNILIADMTGRIIKSEKLNSAFVDISGIQNGIYLVKLFKGNEIFLNSKLVIAK